MKYLKMRLYEYDADGHPIYYAELAGKSTETKPTTGLVSGSKFIEVDTGKSYVFDGISDTPDWNEMIVATAEVSS